MAKLWGGRFTQSTDSFTDHFHSSISFDSRMYKEDITGSMAHAAMLGKQGIIPADDAALIIKTLKEILADIEAGKVTFDEKAEDIHMNVETILISRIGDGNTERFRGKPYRNDFTRLYAPAARTACYTGASPACVCGNVQARLRPPLRYLQTHRRNASGQRRTCHHHLPSG